MTGATACRFDDLLTVHPIGPDRFQAEIDGRWSGFAGAHGGYVASLALRALQHVVADAERLPRTLHVHLLAPIKRGALELEARIERRGRTATVATVAASQDGRRVAFASGSFGLTAPGLNHDALIPPAVPAPEDCAPLFERPVSDAGINAYVEHRPAAEPLPLTGGDRAEILVWMRLGERRPADDVLATFLADAGPPAQYGTLSEFVAIPSTEITVHYAHPPGERDEWVLGVFRTHLTGGGYSSEDGELWSTDGRLLLQTRQMRRVL